MYAVLNVSNDIYNEAYQLHSSESSRYVGQRLVVPLTFFFDHFHSFFSLHNYHNRRDSLDLHVFNVPKLLSTTYQLQEQMRQITREHQVNLNGVIGMRTDPYNDQQLIRKRINELESELTYLKSRLRRK